MCAFNGKCGDWGKTAVITASVAFTEPTCNGTNDGTISITGAAGGSGTYEYSINGGGAWQSGNSFSGLAPITYHVLIRDAANTSCVIDLGNVWACLSGRA